MVVVLVAGDISGRMWSRPWLWALSGTAEETQWHWRSEWWWRL